MSGLDLQERARRFCGSRGFTLIEVLVTLAIASILGVLSLSAVLSLESYNITNAALTIRDVLGNARQLAVSDNLPVEVRFCRNTVDAASPYEWILVCEIQPDGSRRIMGRPVQLASEVCIAAKAALSSVMMDGEMTPNPSDPRLSVLGMQYVYRKVTFLPSGATDLAPNSIWFLTVIPRRLSAVTALPANYATLRIDPVNGLIVLYRS